MLDGRGLQGTISISMADSRHPDHSIVIPDEFQKAPSEIQLCRILCYVQIYRITVLHFEFLRCHQLYHQYLSARVRYPQHRDRIL